MSTQKAVSEKSVVNNGGSVVNGGTDFDYRPVLTSRRTTANTNLGVFASTVVQGTDITTSTSSPYFAEVNEVLAERVRASNIANALVSGAADPVNRRSIHRLEAVRTTLWSTAYRSDKFSLYTGRFVAGYPQVSVDDAMVVVGSVYQDKAADPTRSLPGQLVYRTGAKVPVTGNYSAKKG